MQIQPGASKDALAEIIQHPLTGAALKIRISAAPVDGKANRYLIAYLSQLFSVTKSQITLLSGNSSRYKKLKIQSPAQLPPMIKAETSQQH
ncbi:MAG: DUF167 family protein [Gammaproteobacteria bacterium]|nr:DUF167 family protein [Gammaproteobacteria bacterium]